MQALEFMPFDALIKDMNYDGQSSYFLISLWFSFFASGECYICSKSGYTLCPYIQPMSKSTTVGKLKTNWKHNWF